MTRKQKAEMAVEFLKWCNTPVYRANGELGFRLRVQPQFPEYDTYLVIDATGLSVFPKGQFLSAEELYEYWLKFSEAIILLTRTRDEIIP